MSGGFGAAEEHADLLAQLVNENSGGAARIERTGKLAKRLRHEARLEAHVRVAHLAFDFGLWRKCCDGVDDENVDRARAHEHVGNFESLLAGVGLRHEKCIDIDAELLRVFRIEGVLRIDEGSNAARPLRVCNRVERNRGFTAGLRTVDLDDTTAGKTTDTERDVKCDRPRGNDFDGRACVVAKAHNRAFAELTVNLCERVFERLIAVLGGSCHGGSFRLSPRYEVASRLTLPTVNGGETFKLDPGTGVDAHAPWRSNNTIVNEHLFDLHVNAHACSIRVTPFAATRSRARTRLGRDLPAHVRGHIHVITQRVPHFFDGVARLNRPVRG